MVLVAEGQRDPKKGVRVAIPTQYKFVSNARVKSLCAREIKSYRLFQGTKMIENSLTLERAGFGQTLKRRIWTNTFLIHSISRC